MPEQRRTYTHKVKVTRDGGPYMWWAVRRTSSGWISTNGCRWRDGLGNEAWNAPASMDPTTLTLLPKPEMYYSTKYYRARKRYR